ncbi:MAG: hypothetical protein H7333_00990, partial [Bdellovibrionales bacterium]|nr:hypothetical protein [Oligoflexia bacterium]
MLFKNLLCFILFVFTPLASLNAAADLIQFDDTVTPALRMELNGDFDFLSSVQSEKTSPLHRELFGMVQGASYLQWFNARVYRLGVDVCGGPASVACQMNAYPHQIFVTPNYVQNGYPQIARLMTLFHEARHSEVENNHWPHARCSLTYPEISIWTGLGLKGHYACDSSEYGSYASASVMLNNISK